MLGPMLNHWRMLLVHQSITCQLRNPPEPTILIRALLLSTELGTWNVTTTYSRINPLTNPTT